MSHVSKPHRHQTPEHQKVAQAYAVRVVIGKTMVVLTAGVALSLLFLQESVRSPVSIGLMAFGALCVVAAFIGDFPAFARCPGCGARMRVRTNQDPQPRKRFRYLVCPKCEQRVDLE